MLPPLAKWISLVFTFPKCFNCWTCIRVIKIQRFFIKKTDIKSPIFKLRNWLTIFLKLTKISPRVTINFKKKKLKNGKILCNTLKKFNEKKVIKLRVEKFLKFKKKLNKLRLFKCLNLKNKINFLIFFFLYIKNVFLTENTLGFLLKEALNSVLNSSSLLGKLLNTVIFLTVLKKCIGWESKLYIYFFLNDTHLKKKEECVNLYEKKKKKLKNGIFW